MQSTARTTPDALAVLRAGLGVPLAVVALLAMMVLPLPPVLLDLLFSFNIALSLVILLVTVYALRPLDFAVFPAILLLATLLRLALNVASTRVVLLNGHAGPGAAGNVIQAFGDFVIGGSYAVGLVVFGIFVIINFVVITKGAGRISEVSARFTLDAMPGKQMAIDADLNAGLIGQEDARKRRQDVEQEADFYGAMDGASKFVRGDAVAGILIMIVNIVGGLVVGTMQHDLSFGDAAQTYTLLTIGDGLVAQIPSLVLATASALIVTRVGSSQDISTQVLQQVFGSSQTLAVAAAIVGGVGLVPGMPNVAFLSLGALLGLAAWLARAPAIVEAADDVDTGADVDAEQRDLGWDDVQPVDIVGLEVGYRLIPLVDESQGGELMRRIRGVRKKLSQDLGFLVQPVHIRDNLELSPSRYRITLLGVPVGEAEVHADRDLAIDPGHVAGVIDGIETTDPAFGLRAYWIATEQREEAQALGYTVVDPGTVVATHLSSLLEEHAAELLGHEETQQLLDQLKAQAPTLVEDLVPATLSLSTVVRVLQGLLAEQVPIRDMRSIAERLADEGVRNKEPDGLVAAVRVALGRSIVQRLAGTSGTLEVATLDPQLESMLGDSLAAGDGGLGLEPDLAARFTEGVADAVRSQETAGKPPVLVVSARLRPWLARWLRPMHRGLNVLSYAEVPDNRQIRVVHCIGR
ncbi:MAG: flagellar biosynthesis protein FlhA [Pseudomonadales bacterium]|nr:flagellar biosynthesis protein FlhA [Pseudomonadales bacterium]